MFTEHLLCAKFKAHFKFMIFLSIVKSSSTCKVASEIFNAPCSFKICIHPCVCVDVCASRADLLDPPAAGVTQLCAFPHECWKPLFNH